MPNKKKKDPLASAHDKMGAMLGPTKTIAKKEPQPIRQRLARGCKQLRFEAKAVLSCALEAVLSSRPDQQILRTHYGCIDEHWQKYQHRIDKAQAAAAKGNAAELHAIPAHKAKITEAIGEKATTDWCVQTLIGYEIRSGFAAGIGIDQIWAKKDESGKITHYAVVEAKGPGATLSDNATKGDQMSTQWVKASLEQAANSSKTTAQEKDDARSMLHAIANGPPPEVRGYVIEAKPDGGAIQRGCPDKGIYHAVK